MKRRDAPINPLMEERRVAHQQGYREGMHAGLMVARLILGEMMREEYILETAALQAFARAVIRENMEDWEVAP